MNRKRLLVAAGAGLVLYLLLRKKAAAAPIAPVVPGVVTSGSQSVVIDTNVESETFGLPIEGAS